MDERAWAGRRVFITGATGLVGSWLAAELTARGARVTALIRDMDPQSQLFRSGVVNRVVVANGELEDFSTLDRAVNEGEPEVVFHLGAQALVTAARRAPLATLEANVRGTYNLLEACRRGAATVRAVVVASSDKAYGEPRELPYTEDMPLEGRNIYDASKSCSDLLAQAFHASYGLPVGIARCANTYGGGDLNWDRLVPGTVRALLEGRRPVIRSDGRYVRDYIYVKDVVVAYLTMADHLQSEQIAGRAFNFGNDRPVTVLELVEQISAVCGVDGLEPDIRGTATGEIRSQYLSSSRARELLGWKPQFDLRSGLKETVAWYREFLDR